MTATETKRPDQVWLVAHDFSSCADAAADLALDDLLARRHGGSLVLVHIFTIYVPPSAIDVPGSTAFPHLERAAMFEATRSLERVAERLRAKVRAAESPSAVEIEVYAGIGVPAAGLVEEAEKRGVDRIYIGTHGRTGVKHLLLGSVAERVVRTARAPVVVAHEADRNAEET